MSPPLIIVDSVDARFGPKEYIILINRKDAKNAKEEEEGRRRKKKEEEGRRRKKKEEEEIGNLKAGKE
jgi:hypothetical protein